MHHPTFAADSQMYTDLLEMERKLDWSLSRKRMEVQDVLVKGPMVR
jgi:SWI/SNF-related matrix-associated actin-dependent regulator of chromatin subfamily D